MVWELEIFPGSTSGKKQWNQQSETEKSENVFAYYIYIIDTLFTKCRNANKTYVLNFDQLVQCGFSYLQDKKLTNSFLNLSMVEEALDEY